MAKGEFLNQVAAFSDQIVSRWGASRSPWQSEGWPRAAVGLSAPSGVVVHYTADPDINSVIRWFMDPTLGAKASAHYVVGSAWSDHMRGAAQGLPLVASLPVPVVEVVSPDKVAWHARGANSWALGIEVVNSGRVRQSPGARGWRRWQPVKPGAEEWTSEYPSELGPPILQSLDRVYWYPPYQVGQAEVVARVVAALAFDIRAIHFDPSRIVGHEHVQRNKQDPGPEFPLELVRGVGRSRVSAAQELWASGGDALVQARYNARPIEANEALERLALETLGYLDDSTTSIELFQTMMGLDPDGIMGPRTRAALGERLEEVGFLPPT